MKMQTVCRMALALSVCSGGAALANPDVIVGDLSDIAYYGSSNGTHAFAIGTISCNVGTSNLLWIANNNQHPVIGQNMYRYLNGRFEMIGQSWLKHGFTALTQNLCGTCNGVGGAALGVGCSDPYTAGLNGGQTNAGPRWEVNASTGYFPYRPANPSWSGNIARRLQVKDEDLRTDLNVGAVYFGEGEYVTRDDALAGNAWNNASYRRLNLTYVNASTVNVTMAATTQRTKPAIYAWQAMDPLVQVARVDVPNDGVYLDTSVTPNVHRRTTGTMFIACRVTDNGNGTHHYEYAIENVSSDRCAGGLRFALPAGVVPENIGFRGGLYHDGDGIPTDMANPNTTARNFTNVPWIASVGSTTLRWGTEAWRDNPNANAIRWGTMYNFRFDANAQPAAGTGTIEMFKDADVNSGGSPAEVTFNLPVPGIQIPRNIRVAVETTSIPELIPPGSTLNVSATITPGDDQVNPGSAVAFYRYSNAPGTPFQQIPLTSAGGNTFTAAIPGTGCGNVLSFYVRATGATSGPVTWPLAGAEAPFVRPIGVVTDAFLDNYETDKNWVGVDPSDTATSGRWVRGAPIGTSYNPGTGPVAIQPAAAHGGTNAWFTGQGVPAGPAGAADVDGGRTTLTSPTLDLARFLTARAQYWRWYFGGTGPAAQRIEVFTVQVSNNNGTNWTTIETVPAADSNGGWIFADVTVPLPLTSQMKIRFIAADLGTDETIEAAVDDFRFIGTGCEAVCRVDWDQNSVVGVQDLLSFLIAYFSNNADFNNDSTTSIQDVFDFLAAYYNGCP